jgi:hypothetical protein
MTTLPPPWSAVGPMPSASYSFEFDPHAILGVGRAATLREIRDAFLGKSKKHHPDHGGDDWAFRLVVRASEILSTARVAGHLSAEPADRPEPAAQAEPEPDGEPTPPADWLRAGLRDEGVDPAWMVDVELLLIRYELVDPLELVLDGPDRRNLSCNLNLTWPSPTLATPPPGREVASVLKALSGVFRETVSATRAASSWSRTDAGAFTGWLSYPSAGAAWKALQVLHDGLRRARLGLCQWTREMHVPRPGS